MSKLTLDQTFEILGLHRINGAVFSNLIIGQLQRGLNEGVVHSQEIVEQIIKVQNNSLTEVKGVRQFRGDILKGFYYVHWFEARFIAQNIMNHWHLNLERSKKFKAMFVDTCEDLGISEGDYLNREAIMRITDNFVNGYFERSKLGRLTGEWIVFAKKGDVNYFLTLAGHAEADEDIYLRMYDFCGKDSPDFFQEIILTECRQRKEIKIKGRTDKNQAKN